MAPFAVFLSEKKEILLVSVIRIVGTFPVVQFCREDYSTSYRLDRTRAILLYVSEVIVSK